MKLSDNELIAIGLQVQEARRKGGKTVFTKYGGSNYFKELNRKSQLARKAKKAK